MYHIRYKSNYVSNSRKYYLLRFGKDLRTYVVSKRDYVSYNILKCTYKFYSSTLAINIKFTLRQTPFYKFKIFWETICIRY